MCSIQFVPESDVCPQLVTGHKVCTPNSPINSCNKRERSTWLQTFKLRVIYMREVMKAVVAVQSGFVLADGATFETSKLPSTAVPVHNISICQFCFHRRRLLFHKLSKLVVVLPDVEGEGISVRQQFSADFALVLGIAIACQDFFLVMHCDEVEIEQVLVLGFLITEVTREDFR